MISRPILIAALLASVSAEASGGTLGATSRGSISISITIPPHALVISAPPGAPGDASGRLCLSENGVSRFHVVLAGADGADGDLAPAAAQPNASLNFGCVAVDAATSVIAAGAAEPAPAGPARTVTVLVVAD